MEPPAADGLSLEDVLGSLPPEFPSDVSSEISAVLDRRDETLVVLDDDPTGTQTVHDVPVMVRFSASSLRRALAERPRVLYLSTNSRALAADEAAALALELASTLARAAAAAGRRISVLSRSDSTLRGHYPVETDALADGLGRRFDALVLCPFFAEGGRVTVGDVHWVADGDNFVPVGRTEYARDPAFGYESSNLAAWVEEKTGGRISSAEVASLGVEEIRRGGPDAAEAFFMRAAGGRPLVVNAVTYCDLRVAVAGMLRAEEAGKRFLYRTAASFAKVRGGIADRPLLRPSELGVRPGPGVVVVGSYVGRTTDQLAELLRLPDLVEVELSAERAVVGGRGLYAEAARVGREVDSALGADLDVVVYTSRRVVGGDDPAAAGAAVAGCLVAALKSVRSPVGWAVFKGGVTSHVCVRDWLGAEEAWVLGQVLDGVAVWRVVCGLRGVGLPVVIFPGNVGGRSALADVVSLLREGRRMSG